MKKDKLEYVKVACLVVIAVSLSIIAWKSVSQVYELQLIEDQLYEIGNRISQLNEHY
ncbi:hypothetical protein [Rummeliibacillus pycnus]|uniref:hypothetical protein n=1 Tax=Rummeliibacillus pycnus TaxID=101070 RepID=UPI003D29ED59